ncbi:hypothetical protein HanXRQr2_Chr06g0253551 [Helianthus annuus]|uniref:Uncharacterized protein n=1 Tax=Helianthus annuus TaxID=4232 RepID=A0A9K3NIM4_HELAN|nr:hypothetical protein HanXRQr2_Chr06g0253551 [Helianthus annuus]KAJ0566382.1 hypothetical protein HanIR_Chr06g0273131 [Helianthus annuus]
MESSPVRKIRYSSTDLKKSLREKETSETEKADQIPYGGAAVARQRLKPSFRRHRSATMTKVFRWSSVVAEMEVEGDDGDECCRVTVTVVEAETTQ